MEITITKNKLHEYKEKFSDVFEKDIESAVKLLNGNLYFKLRWAIPILEFTFKISEIYPDKKYFYDVLNNETIRAPLLNEINMYKGDITVFVKKINIIDNNINLSISDKEIFFNKIRMEGEKKIPLNDDHYIEKLMIIKNINTEQELVKSLVKKIIDLENINKEFVEENKILLNEKELISNEKKWLEDNALYIPIKTRLTFPKEAPAMYKGSNMNIIDFINATYKDYIDDGSFYLDYFNKVDDYGYSALFGFCTRNNKKASSFFAIKNDRSTKEIGSLSDWQKKQIVRLSSLIKGSFKNK